MWARERQNPPPNPRIWIAGFWGAIVGPKDLGTPTHLISSPKPMPRRKKCPKTNEGNPDCQIVLPRTTLSSAGQNHRREKRHVARGNPLEDRKRDSKPYRLAIGAWWRSNPKRSCHLHIKYPQLTPWPHWCGCDPWIGRWGPQQLTECQKEWPMGRALEDRHGWLTSVEGGWTKERNPLEDRKRDSKPYRLAIGAWLRSNPKRSRHLHIKYPQLTPWPHWCGCDSWTGRWGPQQLTERQKEWPMRHALEDRHGWLTSVRGGWTKERNI